MSKNKYRSLVSCAVVPCVGLLADAATITATPGFDYKGATITTTGAESVMIVEYGTAKTVFTKGGISGEATFTVDCLEAGKVYDITAGDASKRLYQGDVGSTNVAWFSETATDPTESRWGGTAPDVADQRFVFNEGDETVLTYQTYSPGSVQSDRLAVADMDVTFGGVLDVDDIPSLVGAKAAVRLVNGTGDDVSKYYLACLVGAGIWATNTSLEVAMNSTNNVRMTMDKMNGTVRYDVRPHGEGAYVTLYDGASALATGFSSFGFAGQGTLGTLAGSNGVDTATANVCEAGGVKYPSVDAAVGAGQSDVALLWDATWNAPETGDASAITGSKRLKVLSGKIASGTTLPVGLVLEGGLYADSKKTAYADKIDTEAFRWTQRYADSDYPWEVLAGKASPTVTDEKVYPVSTAGSGGKTINVALSTSAMVSAGYMTAEEAASDPVTAMNKQGGNGNPTWENYVLGLSNSDSSSIPVVKPVQSADAGTVTFSLGGVNVKADSNANVTYTVYAKTTGSYEPVSGATAAYDKTVAVSLPSSGVQYYQLKVDAAGAR